MSISFVDYFSYLLHLLGIVLICAYFLYEDEEGQIQSRVEEWSIKLSDKQSASRSYVTVFMQGVASLTGRGFDNLLGKRLLSLRFVVVSIYLSFASFFLFVLLAFPLIHNPGGATRHGALIGFLFFSCLALVPALWHGKSFYYRLVRGLWWTVIPLTLISLSEFTGFVYKRLGAAPTLRGIGLVILPFVVSFLFDLSYIAITRWTLRRIPEIDHIFEIVLMIAENLVILAILLLGPIYIGLFASKYSLGAGGLIVLSVALNSIDLLIGFAALLLGLLLLLHRLLWPVAQRPLYAIQRFELIKKKKWLIRAGIALIICPVHITFQLLKALLDKLSSL